MIVCCDLDHTLRHSAWRDEEICWAHESGNWDRYHEDGIQDKPSTVMINVLIALHNAGHQIYIVTAVPQKWKRQVFSWLHKNGILIEEDHLLMREYNTFAPSTETKLELTGDLNIDLFIDDRTDVVETFSMIGVTTLQVRLVS